MAFDGPRDPVVSKHLFNFKLDGVTDDAIMANEDEFYDTTEGQKLFEMWLKMEELKLQDDSESIKEYVELYRKSENIEWKQLGEHCIFDEAKQNCIETRLKIPTNHCGCYEVSVHVYTPKNNLGKKKNPCLIYAHGGGVVASSAEIYKPWLVQLAFDSEIVVFNVDYRLAPETKYPNNAKDFYECIRYVSRNASTLNIDPDRIAISGMSGGGYICLSTMVLLAKNDESELVKLAIPEVPMCSDYCFSDMESMTKEERENAVLMRKIWKLISNDLKTDLHDPLLFPDKTRDKLLVKMPPTVMISGEFDIFVTETTRMATKLRAAGRLLEFVVFPGIKHSSNWYPKNKSFITRQNTLKSIFKEYLS
jgi:acetyl esterase/lipase